MNYFRIFSLAGAFFIFNVHAMKQSPSQIERDVENLPTRQEIERVFLERDQQIRADLIRQGYSTERNRGVVDLPILDWKSHRSVPTELDAFKMKQIEDACSKELKTSLELDAKDLLPLNSLLILGPHGCGKTSLAKLIAYKTKKPYIIIPQIFFTSTYTYQRLNI
jgi:ABC-type uncharacterized transport system fused permease/ATPase subunit